MSDVPTNEPKRGFATALHNYDDWGVAEKDVPAAEQAACRKAGLIKGVGTDAPTVVAANGAKQSQVPYRCDLLPAKALLHIASILDAGATKYGDNNWRGLTAEDHLNHALVHALAYQSGDTQDDHAGHCACRMLMWLETTLTRDDSVN